MKVVSKIGVLSLAKVIGLTYAVIGLIFGAIITILTMVLPSEASQGGMMFGALSIIILPIFYGILGFIGGVISAFIYNMIAKWVGGMTMELQDEPTASPAPVQPTQPQM
jgi:hypothetical protein